MQVIDNQNVATNKQKFLGNKGLIAFIALMNMFIPLSTDLYLPALPKMNIYFNTASTITNLTLSAFFISYAVGMLFWGPLSDKFGRKQVLVIGSIIYIASSVSCALSVNIYFLILARVAQGIGAGGITSVSVAMIKDCFSGKKRESILAVTQSISGLAPMLAPIVGALIIRYYNWRGSFWALVIIGILNLILTLLYKETLKEEERYKGNLMGAVGRLFVVAKNKSFLFSAIIFSLVTLPFMGYIALSSYIYINYFGLSEQTYSYFFAANALLSILGPFLYVRFFSGISKKVFAITCFGLGALSGVLVIIVGTLSPVAFMLSFLILSLVVTASRPFSTNLLFEQQKGDTGSASSLINTLFTVFGCIGMSLASLPWGNIVVGLGIVIVTFSCIAIIGWIMLMKSNIPCKGVKDFDKGQKM